MKILYSMLLLACLASCKGSEVASQQPSSPHELSSFSVKKKDSSTKKEDSSASPGLSNYLKQVADADQPKTAAGRVLASITGRGKVKLKNVTIQQVVGDGNKVGAGDTKVKDGAYSWEDAAVAGKGATQATGGSTATNSTKAGQRGGAAATGEGSTATATTEKGISYW